MATAARWVFVDDVDPAIEYGGPWFQSSNSLADAGVSGPIYKGTQHGVNGTASLTYDFSGTNIRVVGTSAVTQSTAGIIDPQWQCSVDGSVISLNEPAAQPQNQRALCISSLLADGPHILIVQVVSLGTPFWVDFMMITPSLKSGSALTHPDVLFTYSDPAVQYPSGNWQTLPSDAGMITQQAGSLMFIRFNGTKVTWYGRMLSGYPSGPSTGTYTIDGAGPVTFNISGLLFNWTTRYQQIIFETPTLPKGTHNLTVKYLGASTPLVLEYLLIKDGDLVFSGAAAPPPLIGDSDGVGGGDHDTGSKTPSHNTGTIVGGIIGAIAIIALIITVFFLWRKLKQRRAKRLHIPLGESPHLRAGNLPVHAYEITPFLHEGDGSPPRTASTLPASPSPSATTFSMASRPPSHQNAMIARQNNFDETLMARVNSNNNMGTPSSLSSSEQMYAHSVSGFTASTASGKASSSSGSTSAFASADNEKARLKYFESLPESARHPAAAFATGSRPLTLANADPDSDDRPTRMVHHQDSGIRLPARTIVDVPPSYTPS